MIRETDNFTLEVSQWQDNPSYAIVNKATKVVEGRGISQAEMSKLMDTFQAALTTELDRVKKLSKRFDIVK